MKRFSILTLVLTITLVISACGARITQTTPTVNPVELQGTMAALALTMVAGTQTAIPTATPLQPTATFTETPVPAPTNTFLPMTQLTPASNGNSGSGDPCIHKVLPATLQGLKIKMRIDNGTKVTVSVSVNLNQNGPQGECGYRSYTLAPQGSVVITDLVEGCYTIWAWNPDPKGYFMVTNGTSCIGSADTPTFDISTGSIQLR